MKKFLKYAFDWITNYSFVGLSFIVLEITIWNILTGDPIDLVNASLIMILTVLALKRQFTQYAISCLSLVVLEMLIWNIATGDPIDIVNAVSVMAFTLLALRKVGLPFSAKTKNVPSNSQN